MGPRLLSPFAAALKLLVSQKSGGAWPPPPCCLRWHCFNLGTCVAVTVDFFIPFNDPKYSLFNTIKTLISVNTFILCYTQKILSTFVLHKSPKH